MKKIIHWTFLSSNPIWTDQRNSFISCILPTACTRIRFGDREYNQSDTNLIFFQTSTLFHYKLIINYNFLEILMFRKQNLNGRYSLKNQFWWIYLLIIFTSIYVQLSMLNTVYWTLCVLIMGKVFSFFFF